MLKELPYSPNIETNLLRTFYAASAEGLENGKNWYADANRIGWSVASKFRIDYRKAIGVIASLSPGLAWDVNVAHAEELIRAYVAGRRGRQLPLVGSYGWANVRKAERILAGEPVLDVLGGLKVRAFYQCILDPSQSEVVCIDRHAFSAGMGVVLSDKELNRKANTGAPAYRRMEAQYKAAAAKIGLVPSAFQAVVWLTWRRLKSE